MLGNPDPCEDRLLLLVFQAALWFWYPNFVAFYGLKMLHNYLIAHLRRLNKQCFCAQYLPESIAHSHLAKKKQQLALSK